jgi:hypothetical protein
MLGVDFSPALLDVVARHAENLYGHLSEGDPRYWREIYAPDFILSMGGEVKFIALCEAVLAAKGRA